ncbi:helix-turn-helix domain-containing protein [Paracoccus sp. DMF-8]|uniref:helix-turn-helix domain-containing protein n=1 Tax=Paracoccus sp. DMF-8 TaxID=3019445 RepID=UPI0023E3773C|nr:helix-turn-helix domain-containing protein [Paracoccus sp. DMF-8]MDF3607540.1 helix-turn-helix domain-containing protein [Paracoccus sp. DMF-8]
MTILKSRATLRRIAEETAAEHGMTFDEITSPSRRQFIAQPRQEAMRRQREAGFSYPVIGWFWDRDHTTVMHGVRAAEARAGA